MIIPKSKDWCQITYLDDLVAGPAEEIKLRRA